MLKFLGFVIVCSNSEKEERDFDRSQKSCEEIRRSYCVDHLSFTVEEGHIYGFLGPNGAGKSTTMNMITGYIGPTEGSIMINGHDMLENPEEAKKCIGYLPEIPPLYTDMTPLEYLRFAAELKGIARDKRKKRFRK